MSGAASMGVYSTLRSPIFLIHVVEISAIENGPLNYTQLLELAQIPTGKINLFDLNLHAIEEKFKKNEWISAVEITKKFPQTVSIQVHFREPVALFQWRNGLIGYVDNEGSVFGNITTGYISDLPTFSGMDLNESKVEGEKIKKALVILDSWKEAEIGKKTDISAIHWSENYGFRCFFNYLFGSNENKKIRTQVDLGFENLNKIRLQLKRLSKVIDQLSLRGVASHQIWADSDKKIVVKTAKGS